MAIGTQTYTRKILLIRFGMVLSLLVIIFLSLSVFERFTIEREMSERRQTAEAEYNALEKRNVQLQEEVEYLSKESSVEAEIRRHFDVAKEGEKVVIIMDEAATATITPLFPAPATPIVPWYMFWR